MEDPLLLAGSDWQELIIFLLAYLVFRVEIT